MPTRGIENFFLVKLRHVTEKHFFIQNRMLCYILFSIVNKEIGKKVHFGHNKDHFCSSIFILTINFPKNGYFSKNKKPLYSHFSGKTKSFTQKIWQKKVLQENIPKVSDIIPRCDCRHSQRLTCNQHKQRGSDKRAATSELPNPIDVPPPSVGKGNNPSFPAYSFC